MRLSEAASYYGSQIQLADALDLDKSTISAHKKQGGIPFGHQCAIEELTEGQLKADRKHDPANVFYVPQKEAA